MPVKNPHTVNTPQYNKETIKNQNMFTKKYLIGALPLLLFIALCQSLSLVIAQNLPNIRNTTNFTRDPFDAEGYGGRTDNNNTSTNITNTTKIAFDAEKYNSSNINP